MSEREGEINTELREERLWALEVRRFSSTRIQIESVTDLGESVSSILEVGSGSGYFTTFTKGLGYSVKTPDIKPWSNPDFLGDVRDLNIDEKFDLMAAFEMLQHLPYAELPSTLEKLVSLSNRYVLISVPARSHRLGLSIEIPRLIAPPADAVSASCQEFILSRSTGSGRARKTPTSVSGLAVTTTGTRTTGRSGARASLAPACSAISNQPDCESCGQSTTRNFITIC